MSDIGLMSVDWEARIDPDRLRRERLQRAKAALKNSDLDALFIFRPEDARYLTGYRHHLGPCFVVGNAVVVLTRDKEPVLWTMDYEQCRYRMPWFDKEQFQPRANFREKGGAQHWVEQAESFFGSFAGKKVGIDIWDFSLEAAIRGVLPKTDFCDGYASVLMRAKEIKTQDEILCLKMANAITEAAMDRAIEALRPGVKECELLAIAWYTMTALGSEWTQCSNIITSGPNTAPYRRFTSDRIIRNGDLVIIDIGAGYNGYWGDLTRTWVCGTVKPTDEMRDMHQKTYDALFNAAAKVKPGATNAEVFEAAVPHVLDNLGHAAGLCPWESPHFSYASKAAPVTLKEGMVLNFEPYVGKVGVGGIRLENNHIVIKDGVEIYTTYPFDERLVITPHRLDATTARTRPCERNRFETFVGR